MWPTQGTDRAMWSPSTGTSFFRITLRWSAVPSIIESHCAIVPVLYECPANWSVQPLPKFFGSAPVYLSRYNLGRALLVFGPSSRFRTSRATSGARRAGAPAHPGYFGSWYLQERLPGVRFQAWHRFMRSNHRRSADSNVKVVLCRQVLACKNSEMFY